MSSFRALRNLIPPPYKRRAISVYRRSGLLLRMAGLCASIVAKMGARQAELIEKGSRNMIRLRNLGHLAVEALREPNVLDNVGTGLRI